MTRQDIAPLPSVTGHPGGAVASTAELDPSVLRAFWAEVHTRLRERGCTADAADRSVLEYRQQIIRLSPLAELLVMHDGAQAVAEDIEVSIAPKP